MGLVAEVLQFFRGEDGDAQISEAKGDLGGEDIVTAVNYQATGFDGNPLPGDYMVVVPGPEEGTFLVVGYLDPKNAGKAREGDLRLYVRDGNGDVQGEFHLTNDGAEPDWEATAGALIARADRTDDLFAEVLAAIDTGIAAAVSSTPGDGGTAALTAASEYLEAVLGLKSAGADKGWVT